MKNMKMICGEIMEKSYAEKVAIAKGAMKMIAVQLDPRYDKTMTIIFALCIASEFDGFLSNTELKFINEVTGIPFTREFLNIDEAKKEAADFLNYLKLDAGEGLKNTFMLLMACLCCCDGVLSDGELNALEKTFA